MSGDLAPAKGCGYTRRQEADAPNLPYLLRKCGQWRGDKNLNPITSMTIRRTLT